MRKLILLFIASIFTAMSMAVPARRGVVRTITLADGTSARVELRGDENFHFYVNTATGQPMSEQADGTWTVDTRESNYTYMVQAVDADGNVSLWSNKETVTTLAAPSLDKGDINGDGVITIADVTKLVNFILGK